METSAVEKKETPAGTTEETLVVTTEPSNVSLEGADKTEAGSQEPESVVAPVVPKKGDAKFAHVKLMEANGIKPEALPKELKMKINAWSMGLRKYEKNPTPKLMEMVKKGSVEIADFMQDWIEKDLPDKTPEQILAENKAKEDKIRIENEAKERERQLREKTLREKTQREEAERRQRDEIARKERELKAKKDAQESKEGRVSSILKEKGKIHYKELVAILGHDNIGESIQVGSIKLLNLAFTNSYRQIK